MLQLLDIDQSALIMMHWHKMISSPLSPETKQLVMNNSQLNYNYLLFKSFLENSIKAGELPALIKQKPKPETKKLFNSVDIPKEYREFMQQYDYWIKLDDLRAFVERPDSLPIDSYAHARDALARVAWMLVKQNPSVTNQTELFEYLAQLVDSMEQEDFLMKLGETTLKGCAKEIFSAGEVVEKKS